MEFSETIVAVIAIICIFAVPFAAIAILGVKAMRNRNMERMWLINQGIIPPDKPASQRTPNRLVSLRNGILLVALGIGLVVGFVCAEYLTIGQNNQFWMIAASIVLFLGIGFLIYYSISKGQIKDTEDENNNIQITE
jgi:hypothetical protein